AHVIEDLLFPAVDSDTENVRGIVGDAGLIFVIHGIKVSVDEATGKIADIGGIDCICMPAAGDDVAAAIKGNAAGGDGDGIRGAGAEAARALKGNGNNGVGTNLRRLDVFFGQTLGRDEIDVLLDFGGDSLAVFLEGRELPGGDLGLNGWPVRHIVITALSFGGDHFARWGDDELQIELVETPAGAFCGDGAAVGLD